MILCILVTTRGIEWILRRPFGRSANMDRCRSGFSGQWPFLRCLSPGIISSMFLLVLNLNFVAFGQICRPTVVQKTVKCPVTVMTSVVVNLHQLFQRWVISDSETIKAYIATFTFC